MRFAPDLSQGTRQPDNQRPLPYDVAMYQAKRDYEALLAQERADQTRKSRRSKKGGLMPITVQGRGAP